MAAFVMDPKVCACEGLNSTRNKDTQRKRGTFQWLTLDQLAGPKWLNNRVHAEIAIKSLEEREHENPDLAKEGIKQYKYIEKTEVHDKVNERISEVSQKSELTAQEFEQVEKDMDQNDLEKPPPKKRRQGKEPKIETPEQKALKTATNARTSALRKLKAELDRANSEVRSCEDLVGKMVGLGYPDSMMMWFSKKVEDFKTLHHDHHAKYIDDMSFIPSSPWDVDRLNQNTHALDCRLKDLLKDSQDFKNGVHGDVKGLVLGKQSSGTSKGK
eukprot:11154456-Lingulodinium_polyedra.AAC.1